MPQPVAPQPVESASVKPLAAGGARVHCNVIEGVLPSHVEVPLLGVIDVNCSLMLMPDEAEVALSFLSTK